MEETPAPALLTGASVVQRYIEVGGQLRALQEEHGRQAAAKLWEAFRYIRINDTLFDPQKREAIDARLRRIQDEIAERSRCPGAESIPSVTKVLVTSRRAPRKHLE